MTNADHLPLASSQSSRTMLDYVLEAAQLHPDDFIDALSRLASSHDENAACMRARLGHDTRLARVADTAKEQCFMLAAAVDDQDLGYIRSLLSLHGLGMVVQGFTAASKLFELTHAERTAIAARGLDNTFLGSTRAH